MFNKNMLKIIAKDNWAVLVDLDDIRKSLNSRFVDLDDAILGLILSVASNEALLLVGPPGTSKSHLIRSFCSLIGLIDENKLAKKDPSWAIVKDPLDKDELNPIGYFEYLLTPFTEPSELFGYYDIGKLMSPNHSERKLERDEANMMQKAYVVYLDEVFNASSAILNSLLAFLQERFFHDRGERKDAYTRALFAATNHTPESFELKAVYDRFLLRCNVKNVEVRVDGPSKLSELISTGFSETYGKKPADQNAYPLARLNYLALFQSIKTMQDNIQKATVTGNLLLRPDEIENDPFNKDLRALIADARRQGLSDMSNRRVVKMMYVLLVHCLYRNVRDKTDNFVLGKEELALVEKYFLDRPKEAQRYS